MVDDDRVTYTIRMPREAWMDWKRSLPYDVTIKGRLRQLIQADTDDDADPLADDDHIHEWVEIDADTYREWADTVPRRIDLDTRIATLIERDLHAARRDGDIEQASVDVMASRIRIRALQAIAALRDDEDADAALDQLEQIQDIADALES